jgi:small-conductance mechanosensitive channel
MPALCGHSVFLPAGAVGGMEPSVGVMELVIKYFSPLWLFEAAADLSFWQRYQLDARMRIVSRFLWRYVMRWSTVTAMLLVPAAMLAHGFAALSLALAGGLSASVTVLMAALAVGCLIGSRWR